MKVRLIVPILILTSIFALTLDYNNTKIVPEAPIPNSKATLITCFLNENPIKPIEDLKIRIETQSCIKSNKYEIKVDEIKYEYCFPIKLYIGDCQQGIYWVKYHLEYYQDGAKEKDIYYTFPISYFPMIKIDKIDVYNNYEGEEAYLVLKILTNQEIRNVIIKFNSSICPTNTSSIYFDRIDYEKIFKIKVDIPNIPIKFCRVPLIITYQDSFGKIYKDFSTITFPVYYNEGRIIIKDNYFEIKNNTEISIMLENRGNKEFKNIIVKLLGNRYISFSPEEFFIPYINKRKNYEIKTKVFLDKSISGLIKVPIIITYTDKFGKFYNDTFVLILNIKKVPNLIASLSTLENNEIEINVYNIGDVKAEGIFLKISCNGCIVKNNYEFIGNLDPNDYDTVTIKVNPLSKAFKLTVKLFYKDSSGNIYNKTFSKEYEIKLKPKENNILLFLLFVLIISVILFKKIKK